MNTKQIVPVPAEKRPVYLHDIEVGGRKLARGQRLTVNPRPGLIAGTWIFKYAEPGGAELLIHVEGPLAREARHKVIRAADVKAVLGKNRRA